MTSPTRSRVYWEETASPPDFPQLSGDVDVDVAVVGGGIVGVSAARFIKDEGITVAVVEARRHVQAPRRRVGRCDGVHGSAEIGREPVEGAGHHDLLSRRVRQEQIAAGQVERVLR